MFGFHMIKRLFLFIIVILFIGCIKINMNKQPNRWVTVLDANTGNPVSGVPLVYMSIRKPYFIVGEVMISQQYVSGKNGKAYVPSGVRLTTSAESNYVSVPCPNNNDKNIDSTKTTTICVMAH